MVFWEDRSIGVNPTPGFGYYKRRRDYRPEQPSTMKRRQFPLFNFSWYNNVKM